MAKLNIILYLNGNLIANYDDGSSCGEFTGDWSQLHRVKNAIKNSKHMIGFKIMSADFTLVMPDNQMFEIPKGAINSLATIIKPPIRMEKSITEFRMLANRLIQQRNNGEVLIEPFDPDSVPKYKGQ